MKKFLTAAAVAAIAVSAPAYASTDGALSQTTSIGKVDFTTVIPNMVRISGLDDMTINVTAAALNNTAFSRQDTETKFCVYSNIGLAGNYNITVDGTAGIGANTPFALQNVAARDANGGKLNYAVWVSDDPTHAFDGAGVGGNGFTYPGTQKTGYQTTRNGNARPATTDCSAVGDNASLHVGVNNSDILAATSGTYKGTLTVTVSTI